MNRQEFWTMIGGFMALGAMNVGAFTLLSSEHASINNRLTAIESRLSAVQARISAVAERVSYIEGHLAVPGRQEPADPERP